MSGNAFTRDMILRANTALIQGRSPDTSALPESVKTIIRETRVDPAAVESAFAKAMRKVSASERQDD